MKNKILEAIMLFQISLLTIIQVWNGFIIIPNYNLIAKDLGVSNFYLGSMSGLYILLGGLSSILWSYLADSIGIKRKWLLMPTLFIAGLLTIVVATTNDVVMFFVCRIFTGIFLGALPPIVYSIIADKFESHKRARAYMVWYLVTGIGLAIGFVSSVLLAMFFDWRYPIMVNGNLLIYVGVPVSAMLLEPKRASADMKMLGLEEVEYNFSLRLRDLSILANNKTVLFVSAEEFISTIPQGVLLAWLTQYVVRDLGAPEIVAIVYLGLGMLGGTLGFLIVHLADKYFRKNPSHRIRIAIVSTLIQALMILTFLSMPLYLGISEKDPIVAVFKFFELASSNILIPISIILFFVGMVFNSSIEPIKNAVISDVNLPEHRAIVISGISTIELFFRSAGIALAGLIIDITGSVRYTLIGFVFLYFVATYLWIATKNTYTKDLANIREILEMRLQNT